MTDVSPKPQTGTVVPVEAKVKAIWRHVTIIVAAIMAFLAAVLAILVQLKDLPFLPTNVATWITVAITVIGGLIQIYQKLYGTPAVTPTLAAKFPALEGK